MYVTFLSTQPPVAFYGLFYLLEPLQINVLSNFHDYVFYLLMEKKLIISGRARETLMMI